MILCANNTHCVECMNSVYATLSDTNGANVAAITNTSTCNSFVSDSVSILPLLRDPPFTSKPDAAVMLQMLMFFCESLPQCTIAKTQCDNDRMCTRCKQLIESGNISGAIEVCGRLPNSTADPLAVRDPPMYDLRLSTMMTSCTFGTKAGCDYGKAACEATPDCQNCYNEIIHNGVIPSMTSTNNFSCIRFAGQLNPRIIETAPEMEEFFGASSLLNTFKMCPRDENEQLDTCELKRIECVLYLGDVSSHAINDCSPYCLRVFSAVDARDSYDLP